MPANVKSMFYVQREPWHKKGIRVEAALTSKDAITQAGLSYNVEKIPATCSFRNESRGIAGKYATIRTDTGEPLGVVGEKYAVLQNREAFSFFDAVVGVKEAMYHTAGALGQGERIWLLAKLPDYVRTSKDDITEKYLLLSNSHDGSSPIEILFTPIRVVCQNTLNIALSAETNKVRLRHTAPIGIKLDDVRQALGLANQRFDLLEEVSKKLASVRINKMEFMGLVQKSGVIPAVADDEMSERAKNIKATVSQLFENGRGAELDSAKGTAWGGWNAIVEYVDFYRGSNTSKRTESLLYGSGARIKQAAWNYVANLAGIHAK